MSIDSKLCVKTLTPLCVVLYLDYTNAREKIERQVLCAGSCGDDQACNAPVYGPYNVQQQYDATPGVCVDNVASGKPCKAGYGNFYQGLYVLHPSTHDAALAAYDIADAHASSHQLSCSAVAQPCLVAHCLT